MFTASSSVSREALAANFWHMKMKWKLLILTQLCLLASCASLPPWSAVDRYGLMKINIPGDYSDHTQSYLQKQEKLRASRGKPQNMSIKSLLMIKRNDDKAFCKFRELSYFQSEAGYSWDIERIAEGVAHIYNNILTTHGMVDHYHLGLAAQVGAKKASRVDLVSSSAVTLNGYNGWQTTYSYPLDQSIGINKYISSMKTVVLRMPTEETNGGPKRYLVVECQSGGTEGSVNYSMRIITEMLNTIQLGSDIK